MKMNTVNITLKQIIQRKIIYYENDKSQENVIVNKGYVRGYNQILVDMDMEEAEFITKYADIVENLKSAFETVKAEEEIEELSGYNNAIVDVLGLLDEKLIFDENI